MSWGDPQPVELCVTHWSRRAGALWGGWVLHMETLGGTEGRADATPALVFAGSA